MMRRCSASMALLLAAAGCGASVTPPPVGKTVTSIAGIPGRPFGVRVSSTGTAAVTQQDLNTITLVSASGSGTRGTVSVGADPGDVVFNAAGTTAYVSGFNDGSIKAVSVSAARVTGSVTIGSNAYRMALSPDGSRLYVTTTSGSVVVVNPATMTQGTSVGLAGSLQGIALHATGLALYVTSTDGTISRLLAGTLTLATSTRVGGKPADVAVAGADELLVANEDGWVDVLNVSTLASKARILIPGASPFGLAVTHDGAHAFVASTNGDVIIIDRATRTITQRLRVGGLPRRIAFTPDGLSALVANEAGRVDVIR
jgi:DNA-binding beta-propeller fold protein YncE